MSWRTRRSSAVALKKTLGEAVREKQLFLKYEPIVDASTQEVRALEAHILWMHEQRGEIDEEEFASILDGSTQVTEVGTWAIEEACKHASQWPESIRVAVNVPVPLFKHPMALSKPCPRRLRARRYPAPQA